MYLGEIFKSKYTSAMKNNFPLHEIYSFFRLLFNIFVRFISFTSHLHTHTYIYIYIYMCVCVCVCVYVCVCVWKYIEAWMHFLSLLIIVKFIKFIDLVNHWRKELKGNLLILILFNLDKK